MTKEKKIKRVSRRKSPMLDVNGEMVKRSNIPYYRKVLSDRQALKDYPMRWEPGFGCTTYDHAVMPMQAFGILAEGKTIHSVLAEFGIQENVLLGWMKKFPEFDRAVRVGMVIGYEWWLEAGRKNISNNKFNNQLYEMQMRNRFRWLDRIGGPATEIQNSLTMVQNIVGEKKKVTLENLPTEDLEKLKSILTTAEAC